MSKKKQKFGDIWVNQTTLGQKFRYLNRTYFVTVKEVICYEYAKRSQTKHLGDSSRSLQSKRCEGLRMT